MMFDELIKLIPLVVAVVGVPVYFLKDYFDRRKEAEIKRIADRRDHYQTLLLSLKYLSEGNREHDGLLLYEYFFLWLYAPDPVIRSFNSLLHRLNSAGDAPLIASEVAELILAMRRDLGFERTKLSASEFEPHTNP